MQKYHLTEGSGAVAPKNSDAQAAADGLGTEGKSDKSDYPSVNGGDRQLEIARQRAGYLTAKADLLGRVLQPIGDAAWQLLNQFGQPATVPSLNAAEAIAVGCELARADMALLIAKRGGQHYV